MDWWWDQKEQLEQAKRDYERQRAGLPDDGEARMLNINRLMLSDWDKRFLRSIKIAT